ncbi:hypothetical protein OF846_005388 [Rhodotorula toruloides]|nr:hypothetical protein OF846_005388 [Rhodotorula toruloides]
MRAMPPIRSRPIPPDTAANLRDKEGAARIGLLMVGLQEWIDTWWNEHLFHIDVRIRSSEPPFASNRALRYNFCTWWLLNETQQAEIVEWLTDLSRSIRRGEFDRADTLPPFKDLRLATPIYAVRERDAGTPQGQLSTRLGTASVTKAMNWCALLHLLSSPLCSMLTNPGKAASRSLLLGHRHAGTELSTLFVASRDDRFWERRIQGDGVYEQVVPPVTRFSWRKVAQVLMSTHDRVTQEGLSIENFLFQAHEGKPYLALWFCLTVQQQGDVVDFLKTRCDHLRTHGEQALVNPSRYVALQQAVAYRLACRLLSILHPWHSTSRCVSPPPCEGGQAERNHFFAGFALSRRHEAPPRFVPTARHRPTQDTNLTTCAVREATDQHALIKTTSEGYDHEPPMPACLASSAHSLGSSLLNNFSHRQRAIYAF